MTPFTLLRSLSGMSQEETAEFLDVSVRTVQSWDVGRRTPPAGIIVEMRALIGQQERAADEALRTFAAQVTKFGSVGEVEIGYCTDDGEARELGYPCVGAHSAMIARVIAAIPAGVSVVLAPRGATIGTAAAADAHGR